MALSIGRVRPCQLFDYTFVVLSNNMVRGAAGGSILIGELLVKEGLVFW
jgi:aspartate-semialdehyde dehydrogenase